MKDTGGGVVTVHMQSWSSVLANHKEMFHTLLNLLCKLGKPLKLHRNREECKSWRAASVTTAEWKNREIIEVSDEKERNTD